MSGAAESRAAEERRAWDRFAAAVLVSRTDPMRAIVFAGQVATAMLEERRRRFPPPPAHRPEATVPVLLLPEGTTEDDRRRVLREIGDSSLPQDTRVEVRTAPASARGAA